MWREKSVCSSYNWAMVPHTCLSCYVNTKGEWREFGLWYLSATAGATGCTSVVVSESWRSHLLRGS